MLLSLDSFRNNLFTQDGIEYKLRATVSFDDKYGFTIHYPKDSAWTNEQVEKLYNFYTNDTKLAHQLRKTKVEKDEVVIDNDYNEEKDFRN